MKVLKVLGGLLLIGFGVYVAAPPILEFAATHENQLGAAARILKQFKGGNDDYSLPA